MIQAVFFDCDGTILSHKTTSVPQSTKTAFEELKKKGIKRVMATGRHTSELDVLPVAGLEFDAYLTLNGQLCLDGNRNIYSADPIVGEDLDILLQIFNKKEVAIGLVEKDELYINIINDEVIKAQKAINTPVPEVKEYDGKGIYAAIAFLDREHEYLVKEKLLNCKITRWDSHALDIIYKNGGKVEGIKSYLKLNNINQSETMAFGDGENDMEMLKFVQTGIAMGNGDKEVKEIADYVTDDIDEGGIYSALKHFGII